MFSSDPMQSRNIAMLPEAAGQVGLAACENNCKRLRPVAANRELIRRMEAKVKGTIDWVWGN
jgi:hypothetical protein